MYIYIYMGTDAYIKLDIYTTWRNNSLAIGGAILTYSTLGESENQFSDNQKINYHRPKD